MSDVLEAIKNRRSIRKYKDTMVPDEIIDKIIEEELIASYRNGQTVSDYHCSYQQRTSGQTFSNECKIYGSRY